MPTDDNTSRELLIAAGQLLFGEQWQNAFARAAADYRETGTGSLDPRLVRRWVAGDRPVPPWTLRMALAMISERRAAFAVLEARLTEHLRREERAS